MSSLRLGGEGLRTKCWCGGVYSMGTAIVSSRKSYDIAIIGYRYYWTVKAQLGRVRNTDSRASHEH